MPNPGMPQFGAQQQPMPGAYGAPATPFGMMPQQQMVSKRGQGCLHLRLCFSLCVCLSTPIVDHHEIGALDAMMHSQAPPGAPGMMPAPQQPQQPDPQTPSAAPPTKDPFADLLS